MAGRIAVAREGPLALGSTRSRTTVVPPLTTPLSSIQQTAEDPQRPSTGVQQSRNMLWEELINDDVVRFQREQQAARLLAAKKARETQEVIRQQMELKARQRAAERVEDVPLKEKIEQDTAAFRAAQAARQLKRREEAAALKRQQDALSAKRQTARLEEQRKAKEEEDRALESARRAAAHMDRQAIEYRAKEARIIEANRQTELQWAAEKRKAEELAKLESQAMAKNIDGILIHHAARDYQRRKDLESRTAVVDARIVAAGATLDGDLRKRETYINNMAETFQHKHDDERKKRDQLHALQAARAAQETRKAQELQARERQIQKQIEKQQDAACAAQIQQDLVAADVQIELKQMMEADKRATYKQQLDAQLELQRRQKVRGVDGIGAGVSTVEWQLAQSLRRSNTGGTASTPALSGTLSGRVVPTGRTPSVPFHVESTPEGDGPAFSGYRKTQELATATMDPSWRPSVRAKPKTKWYD